MNKNRSKSNNSIKSSADKDNTEELLLEISSLRKSLSDKELECERLLSFIESNDANKVSSEDDFQQSLIEQLFKTQEELLALRSVIYGDNVKKDSAELLYGARDRVKNDLPYRLGSVLMQSFKKPKDIPKIPVALKSEYNKSIKECRDKPLPPVELYTDYEEAEKVMNHLTYRIGLVTAQSIDSPEKLLKLPFKIARQVYLFKKQK